VNQGAQRVYNEQKSRREVIEANRGRYLRANKAEKQKILDFIVETTGYNRSYAIRSLRHLRRSKGLKKPGRKRIYQGHVREVLEQTWEWCDRICSKRVQPYLPELVAKLESCGAMKLDGPV